MEFAERYRDAMKCHSMGNALYEPAFTSELYSGKCGFLGKHGSWQPLFDITDSLPLQLAGIEAPEDAGIRMRPKEIDTGVDKPFTSQLMKKTRHEFAVKPPLEAVGIPASCSFWWEFESAMDFGAVLVCPRTLTKDAFNESNEWAEWAKDNARAIIKAYPKVKEGSFFIVTSTYATKEAWINVWNDKSNMVSIDFSVGVEGIVELSPSVAFARGTAGSNWRSIPSKGTTTEDIVVFFTGVEMKYTRLPLGIKRLHEVRGEEEIAIEDPEDETIYYQVEIETVGF